MLVEVDNNRRAAVHDFVECRLAVLLWMYGGGAIKRWKSVDCGAE